MSKNGTESKLSYGQYRLADILLFLLIMCVCEIINVLAIRKWFQGMMFTVSVMLLVSLIVIIRWNWLGVLFPIVDGAIYCWLCGATGVQFGVYIIGNAFVAIAGLLFLVVPKEKIVGKWYLTVAYALLAFVLLLLGRTLTALCFGEGFVQTLTSTVIAESLNLLFAIAGLVILRRLDGMLADQKKYLFRVTKERDELKRADEYRWDGYTELDEDELKDLAAMDEYDRALHFNRRSLNELKARDGHETETPGEAEEISAEDMSPEDILAADGRVGDIPPDTEEGEDLSLLEEELPPEDI